MDPEARGDSRAGGTTFARHRGSAKRMASRHRLARSAGGCAPRFPRRGAYSQLPQRRLQWQSNSIQARSAPAPTRGKSNCRRRRTGSLCPEESPFAPRRAAGLCRAGRREPPRTRAAGTRPRSSRRNRPDRAARSSCAQRKDRSSWPLPGSTAPCLRGCMPADPPTHAPACDRGRSGYRGRGRVARCARQPCACALASHPESRIRGADPDSCRGPHP